jgi:glycerophosphoryl diester phosphodiesterase
MLKLLVLLAMTSIFCFGEARMVKVHGHRGARAMRPENTIPAFEYAISVGVDALELDMAITKDNVIVVSHDPYLEAPVCTGPRAKVAIHSLTLAEVRQWDCGAVRNPGFPTQQTVPGTRMPTLEEVFNLAPKGKFLFNIETKITPQTPDLAPTPEEFVKLVLEMVRKHHLESRVILQSFDFRTLHEMKKAAPEIRLSALVGGPDLDFVAIGKESGATVISPLYTYVTREQINAAHAAGLEVLPWTPNKPEEWDRLVAAGADGIITDNPAALIAWLKNVPAR